MSPTLLALPETSPIPAVVLVLADGPAVGPGKCPVCFGWGFTWADCGDGEPMPGADCACCHGTGGTW